VDNTEFYRAMLGWYIGEMRRRKPSAEEFPKTAQAYDRDIWEARQVRKQRTITHRDVWSMFDRMSDFALMLYAESP
jgi:hypothetical protein